MQGRLLPKYKGNYQAHPVNYWQEEFPIASSLGLKCIEFILDFEDYEKNPLMTSKGINVFYFLMLRIKHLIKNFSAIPMTLNWSCGAKTKTTTLTISAPPSISPTLPPSTLSTPKSMLWRPNNYRSTTTTTTAVMGPTPTAWK